MRRQDQTASGLRAWTRRDLTQDISAKPNTHPHGSDNKHVVAACQGFRACISSCPLTTARTPESGRAHVGSAPSQSRSQRDCGRRITGLKAGIRRRRRRRDRGQGRGLPPSARQGRDVRAGVSPTSAPTDSIGEPANFVRGRRRRLEPPRIRSGWRDGARHANPPQRSRPERVYPSPAVGIES